MNIHQIRKLLCGWVVAQIGHSAFDEIERMMLNGR